MPRSYTKTEREAALGGLVYCKVGDTDNCAKSVLDALTKAGVWQEDKQTDELHVLKRYGLAAPAVPDLMRAYHLSRKGARVLERHE